MHTITINTLDESSAKFAAAWEWAKRRLADGRRVTLSVGDEKRSLSQNDILHAICTDLAVAGVPWCGKPRNKTDWKILLVSGHAVATGRAAEVVPGLEGEFVNLRESTASMTKERGSSLIEYAAAFAASHGRTWKSLQKTEGADSGE